MRARPAGSSGSGDTQFESFVCCPRNPAFIAYDARCLPAWSPRQKRLGRLPILAWTVRSEPQRTALLPHCDSIISEGFFAKGRPAGSALAAGLRPDGLTVSERESWPSCDRVSDV